MQDKVIADGKWEFNVDVTNAFDDMLERSIPDYNNMRELTFNIGSNFIKQKTSIVDIGCSNGIAIKPFIDRFGAYNTYKLYDVSEPMLEATRKKFKNFESIGIVDIQKHDLRQGLPPFITASLVLSILTLQFTPIEYRQKIIDSIYSKLETGGAFILVEKVLGNTYSLDDLFVKEYYAMKSKNQYTQEQIMNKRTSLEGVLVPITAKWNEELLYNSGFKQVDCFWRNLNFCGWVAIK